MLKFELRDPDLVLVLELEIYHGLKQPKCFLGDFYQGSNVDAGSPKAVVNLNLVQKLTLVTCTLNFPSKKNWNEDLFSSQNERKL
jgi:hypothetical protein